MKRLIIILILPMFFIVNGCKSEDNPVTPVETSTEEMYELAMWDAMVAEENEIYSNLIAIKPENNYLNWSKGYVLVVTWTKYSSSYPVNDTISTWWGETWVTAAPELKDWYKKNPVSKERITLRTEQLLGLPMNSGNAYIVEMWVNPDDLLRPAYDNEINDNICGLFFPETVSADYISWFNGNIIYSYYPQKNKNKYPWTRLGYTYDWGNPSNEIGLSEFLIKKDAKVIVKTNQSTEDYIQ
ncbi:MAG: hypothetical protein C4539_06925 [Ignavibacteriales bacterium]|nr:MAG: hypothetical protein C4539_06925 [Ignavibacteriales bacterium]